MESIEDSTFDGAGLLPIGEADRSNNPGGPPPVPPEPAVNGNGSAPVVVIEYRQHGLLHKLMPAALLFLAALAISSFQRRTPVRMIPNRELLVETPVPKRVDNAPEAKPTPAPVTAKFIEPKGAENPFAASTAKLEPAVVPSSASVFELDPADGLQPLETNGTPPRPGFVDDEPEGSLAVVDNQPAVLPPAPTVEPLPPENNIAAAPPTEDDVLNEMRREAREKGLEQDRLANLRPEPKGEALSAARERITANRKPFHADLKELVRSNDAELYQMVDNLCNRYGRTLDEEMKKRYTKAQRSFNKRMTRRDEVIAMRKLGLPEPMILDFLVNKAMKNINARSGPSNSREAVAFAAKQLLAIPLSAGTSADDANKAASTRKAVPTSAVSKPSTSAKAP